MIKKYLLLIFVLSISVTACKKAEQIATEIKDKLISGYWQDLDGLVIQIDQDMGTVVEYGNSNLGTDKNVFDKNNMWYIKGINRTGPESFTAEIVKGTYDNNKLTEIKYEPTKITVSTGADGKDKLTFSNADSKEFTKLPDSYTPPANNNNGVSCDTVSFYSTSGNTIHFDKYMRGDTGFTDVRVRSHLYMPLNHSATTPCNYSMDGDLTVGGGNTAPFHIYFASKPTSGTYKVINYGYGPIVALKPGEVKMNFEYYYEGTDTSGVINVSVSGNTIMVTGDKIVLPHNRYNDITTILSFKFTGK